MQCTCARKGFEVLPIGVRACNESASWGRKEAHALGRECQHLHARMTSLREDGAVAHNAPGLSWTPKLPLQVGAYALPLGQKALTCVAHGIGGALGM